MATRGRKSSDKGAEKRDAVDAKPRSGSGSSRSSSSARSKGARSGEASSAAPGSPEDQDEQTRRQLEMGGVVPELARKIVAAGMQSFFSTEEVLRKAVGDTLPQDWRDFASDQSSKTQSEFIDRLVKEVGRVLEGTDLAELMARVLEDRSVEIHASVRLAPRSEAGSKSSSKDKPNDSAPGRKGPEFTFSMNPGDDSDDSP